MECYVLLVEFLNRNFCGLYRMLSVHACFFFVNTYMIDFTRIRWPILIFCNIVFWVFQKSSEAKLEEMVLQ